MAQISNRTQKMYFICHHLLILMLFQTRMTFFLYKITMELFELKGPLKQRNSFANLIKQFNNLSTSPQVLYTWHDQSAKRSKAGRGDI